MKKLKFIAYIFAIMTTMPILQSCLDDDDSPSDLLVISTINMMSQDSKDFISPWMMERRCIQATDKDGITQILRMGSVPLSCSTNWRSR